MPDKNSAEKYAGDQDDDQDDDADRLAELVEDMVEENSGDGDGATMYLQLGGMTIEVAGASGEGLDDVSEEFYPLLERAADIDDVLEELEDELGGENGGTFL